MTFWFDELTEQKPETKKIYITYEEALLREAADKLSSNTGCEVAILESREQAGNVNDAYAVIGNKSLESLMLLSAVSVKHGIPVIEGAHDISYDSQYGPVAVVDAYNKLRIHITSPEQPYLITLTTPFKVEQKYC